MWLGVRLSEVAPNHPGACRIQPLIAIVESEKMEKDGRSEKCNMPDVSIGDGSLFTFVPTPGVSMSRYSVMLVLLVASCLTTPLVQAGQYDLGLGLSFVDSSIKNSDGLELGLDFQIGYEFTEVEDWNLGGQLEIMRGWSNKNEVLDETDLAFSANGIYFTARPKNWFVTFRTGIVQADYTTWTRSNSGTGFAYGLGIVIGSGDLRLHVFDYQHIKIGNDDFDMYTISVAVLGH